MARIIGLTGGIACGKSTVANMLRTRGAHVIDADLLARQVVAPGTPALAEIAAHFGTDILHADGSLDRGKLGAQVFADEEARRALNAIIHPRIAQASQSEIARLAASGADPIIYEAALIAENKLYTWMDAVIVVNVPPEVQLARLLDRESLTEAQARDRIQSQLPQQDKIAIADFVIDNGHGVEETRAQVEQLWAQLRKGTPA